MTITRIDPNLLSELKEYGNGSIQSCFHCGNCTAVCSLSNTEDNFPRRLIRYAQMGMKDELIGSKELWLCYNCGECSETCPKQAEPAAFMMAARSYAVASYDYLGLGKALAARPILGTIILVIMNFALFLFMYTNVEPIPNGELKLFDFLPYDFVHTAGLWMLVITAMLGITVIINMVIKISRQDGFTIRSFLPMDLNGWWQALWEAVARQALGQKRYRDCDNEHSDQPWYLNKWFIHASAIWGFLGLILATGLDYFLDIIGVKPTGEFVPIWYPVRLLGTIAGAFLIYGVSVLILRRLVKPDKAHSNSTFSDWIFLILLWMSGMTGFLVEISLYLPPANWGYWMLLVHVAFSAQLILLLPFSKFAHAILRTTALFVHALKPVPAEQQLAEQPASTD
jgi:ferredoxin